jgi:hypothetical protein
VAAGVGVVAALLVWLWVRTVRRPCRLEISGQAIVGVGAQGQRITLSRQWGDELRVVSVGGGRYRNRGLAIRGASTVIPLPFFSPGEIRRQCVASGWRFESSPRVARQAGRGDRGVPHGHGQVQVDPAACGPMAVAVSAVSDPPAQAELPMLVDEGLRMVRDRLAASPGFSIYLSIQRQLEYLQETIAAGQVPSDEKLDSLTLGVYAAREFETADPAFADVLFKVNYLANRMS